MEIDVNNGAFQVVMESVDLNVVVGESARIDVGEAINYIKSGQAEIEEAVIAGKNAFNANATAKTNAFNQNATDKTTAFNNNATSKTNDFNDNYTAKKALIDAQVSVAEGAATTAKQYAIGDPSEPTGNSAKYWAEQAASELSGLTSRVSTIEGKIPSDASSSNQLADKAWVGDQGYITGITSGDVTTALGYTPYDASNPNGYTSNVGTVTSVNNTLPDGSGNVIITIPDPLPSQTGQSGKYLTTDGTNPSWNTITIPSVDVDGKSINLNASNELQAIGVINQNDTTTAIKTWTGTKAQYDAIVTKDANTLYNVTDDTDVSLTILEALYPVGSIYITTNVACPLSTLIAGSTWVLQGSGVVTSISSAASVPCKGNGMTLGITNGSTNYGMFMTGGSTQLATGMTGNYGANVGTGGSGSRYTSANSFGVTTDPTKSGIIADTSSLLTTTSLSVNIYRRTA